MAVDKEFQQLKEAGQTHKAEHVQQLYAWKSKRALQVSALQSIICMAECCAMNTYSFPPSPPPLLLLFQAAKGAYSIDTEGPLQRAREKLQHAVTVKGSDHSSFFHLGRLSLLLGDKQTAESCLLMAASIKPTHPDTLLCLGLAVSAASSSKLLLSCGLAHYLQERERTAESPEQKPKNLYSHTFWRPSNALIVGTAIMQS